MPLFILLEKGEFPGLETIVGVFAIALLIALARYVLKPMHDADKDRTTAFMSMVDKSNQHVTDLTDKFHVVHLKSVEAIQSNTEVMKEVKVALGENREVRHKMIRLLDEKIPERRKGEGGVGGF